VAEEGGEIKAIDDMGMRRLAYPIEKQERGYYSVIYYTAPSELVGELERQLRYNEEVLRFMTVKYTNKKELGVFEKMVEKTNGRNTTPSEEKGETPAETETAAEEATAEGTEA
jgi:small subunit ribosomal protein S6